MFCFESLAVLVPARDEKADTLIEVDVECQDDDDDDSESGDTVQFENPCSSSHRTTMATLVRRGEAGAGDNSGICWQTEQSGSIM